MKVAIIGGGIAGLTLAASLDAARFDVDVYEAQPEREGGAALGLWPQARRELTALGVELPWVRDDRVEVSTLSGRRRLALPAPPLAQVRRSELMAALAGAMPPTVRRVHALIDDPVHDERLRDADLVVGADGVRSRVRGVVDPRAAHRRATPWVTLRGITATDGAGPDDSRTVAHEFWGAGRMFGDASVVDGRYWFTAHRSDAGPEPLHAAAILDEARERFAAAAPHVVGTLARADASTLATRLWVTPPMRRYVCGRYIVIGDAAHAALPNLARGASDAVVDAVTLAAALGSGRDLRTWQSARLVRTQAHRTAAFGVMRLATSGLLGR